MGKIYKDTAPQTLRDNPFYGIVLDEEQEAFRGAIWDEGKQIVFCNADAGTGKTLVSVATALLLVGFGRYDGIVYIASPTQEQKQGFLAGSIQEKSAPYFEPFYDALSKVRVDPAAAVLNDNGSNSKTAYIRCTTHTYLRGCNFENKVVIIDEAQNYYTDELKKTLTRIHDNCKVIVIGHTGQIDLYNHPERSGFQRYLKHFEGDERTAVCRLTQNHRGWISSHADKLGAVDGYRAVWAYIDEAGCLRNTPSVSTTLL